MTRVFAPSLGSLVAQAARQPLDEADPAELARLTLDMARRTAVTHVLFPFDVQVIARAVADTDGLLDAEPAELVAAPPAATVLEAAAFVAKVQRVAAHVPSPTLVLEQLGTDDEGEARDCAEDLCTALARALLDAGASVLVVVTAGGEAVAELDPFRRLAEVFDADCVFAGPATGDVARLSFDDLLDPERAIEAAGGSRVVLVEDALPADADLAAVTKSAKAIAEAPTC